MKALSSVVLAEWLSKKGVAQCHIAETEKYAHVTFVLPAAKMALIIVLQRWH
jgi:bisphosphoglycerate-independent phosphoglycerate mutase (AlkP superfamily)